MAMIEGKRRSWSVAERQAIVAEATAAGASVALTARRHGVNANLVFKWIRRSREGWLDRRCGPRPPRAPVEAGPCFVPIEIVEAAVAPPRLAALPAAVSSAPSGRTARQTSGLRRAPYAKRGAVMMEIVLPNGARMSCEVGIDEATLRRVLVVLGDVRC